MSVTVKDRWRQVSIYGTSDRGYPGLEGLLVWHEAMSTAY